MRNLITKKFEGKGFWCDACRKTHDGVGFLYNGKGYY